MDKASISSKDSKGEKVKWEKVETAGENGTGESQTTEGEEKNGKNSKEEGQSGSRVSSSKSDRGQRLCLSSRMLVKQEARFQIFKSTVKTPLMQPVVELGTRWMHDGGCLTGHHCVCVCVGGGSQSVSSFLFYALPNMVDSKTLCASSETTTLPLSKDLTEAQ